MKKPAVPLSAHDALELGLSCTKTLHPAGAIGVLMQLKCPLMVVHAETKGFDFDGRSMLSVSSVCWIKRSQLSVGCVVSVILLIEMKCAFTSCVALSAGSCRWSSGDANW